MGSLLRYTIKKIIIGAVIVFLVSLILFFFMQLLPGDPITLLTAGKRVTQERIEQLKKEWGLDKPIFIQFFYWLIHVFQGDFGLSFVTKRPVSETVFARIPVTLQLTLTALILSYVIGLLFGVVAALRRGTILERLSMSFSIFLYSIPSYVLGIIVMLIFGFYLRIFPISGYGTLAHLFLPVLTLALPEVASFARLTRTEMLEVLTEDFVRTARAKGLSERTITFKHVLRNSLIPVTVYFFLYLPWTIGGAVIVEAIFAWPGMGSLFYRSILMQDYSVVLAIVFIITILTVVCNVIGDILTAVLDPRISIEGR